MFYHSYPSKGFRVIIILFSVDWSVQMIGQNSTMLILICHNNSQRSSKNFKNNSRKNHKIGTKS